MTEAVLRLGEYLKNRPMPFYPWLRKLAWDHMVTLHRRHVVAQKRSIHREERECEELGDDSVMLLVDRLVSPGASPSALAVRNELRQRVRNALESMNEIDREVLLMKYLEHLKLREIAASLEISETAAKARHVRALSRFADCMKIE
jgi:RNA polymerase sigma-70 factor (ECF subfamily)